MIGMVNADMFGSPSVPGEHVDWSTPDIRSADDWREMLGMSVEECAERSPNMIVFNAMTARQVVRGRTCVIVTIDNAPSSGVDDESIREFALEAAGETRSSTFGVSLGWFALSPGVAQATIHID